MNPYQSNTFFQLFRRGRAAHHFDMPSANYLKADKVNSCHSSELSFCKPSTSGNCLPIRILDPCKNWTQVLIEFKSIQRLGHCQALILLIEIHSCSSGRMNRTFILLEPGCCGKSWECRRSDSSSVLTYDETACFTFKRTIVLGELWEKQTQTITLPLPCWRRQWLLFWSW